MPYTLHRTLPNGQERTQGPFRRSLDAANAAAHCLHDNGAAGKAEAQRFGALLCLASLGTTEAHASGYAFRIEKAEA